MQLQEKFPKEWESSLLGDCVDILDSKRIPINAHERDKRINGKAKNELFPYYGATGQVGWIDDYIFNQEAVLVGEDGAPFLNSFKDKAYLVIGKYWVNNHAHILIGKSNVITNKFLMHYLNFFNYRDYVTGTTRLKLNQGNLRKFIIPLPKYELQIKIVSKIEELFSQLDAGQASLERARVNLRRYRQSLLKAAFSGELTRAWREEHKNDLEPANELLNRIHTERHASHKVILYQKSKKRSETKTQEYALPSNGKNDVIPKEWAWGTIEIFSKPEKNSIKRGPFGSSIKKAYFVEEGYKVYQQGNVINDDFEFGTYYLNEERYKELEDFKIESGDILISCSGTIGRIAQVPNQFRPGVINQALLKISLDPKVINPKYFIWMFREAVEDILQNSVQGVAIQNIASVKVLKSIPFPLPPLTEQDQLVSEIERNFSIIDELIISIIRIEKRRSLLKNSILEKAFSGQLI